MKNADQRNIIRQGIRKVRLAYLTGFIILAVNGIIFLLYRVMSEPFFYTVAVTLAFFITITVISCCIENKRAEKRKFEIESYLHGRCDLPETESAEENEYRQVITELGKQVDELNCGWKEDRQDILDYYTAWAHQIKTPIAVMKLKLTDDTEENRSLSAELFRIEQYVEMVLQYARLGSESNDLLIGEYNLDELIRESIRKYAPQFILNKLKMDFKETKKVIVTDKKWFCCILEQLLSNAVKYTTQGGVSIRSEDGRLVIEDTGIGISPEDIPRIFEKGYTGINGRTGKMSSGLGLYLAHKAAELLCISISVESVAGQGSRFILDFDQKEKNVSIHESGK